MTMEGAVTRSIEFLEGGLGRAAAEEMRVSTPASHHDALLADLVERVKSQDALAFENLISHTSGKAFGLAYHLTGDYHRAQDIVQEAYLKVFRHIGSLRNPDSFKSWLAQIIANLAREWQQRKGKEIPLDTSSLASAAPPQPLKESALDAACTRESVKEALGALSLAEKTTILLREYCDLTYEEISKTLKIPLGTVKSRLSEARKKMALWLSGKEEHSNEMQ
ncbi:MAG: RNA polymerase sigma factor [Candidatus Eremiobacteraeota bacterium]|nr:RNA polymerase sigma factor [Candidatus Eremiobacteraeota bacterium]